MSATLPERLKALLHRTRFDVSLASAACSAVATLSAALPAEPVMEGYSELWVEFTNGARHSWVIAPCKAYSAVWAHFLKWFHGRDNSPHYVMRHSDGFTSIPRSRISHYNIYYGQRARPTACAIDGGGT